MSTDTEIKAALDRIADALRGPRVPAGRSFLNDAVDAKLADSRITVLAPKEASTPEELAVVEAKAAEDLAATTADATAAGFGGGPQGVEVPAGENFGDVLRRQVLGG